MICEVCGTEFKPKTGGQKYCSPVCYLKAKYRQRAKRQKEPALKEQLRTCAFCGQSFTSTHYEQQYCSVECVRKAAAHKLRLERINRAANETTARAIAKVNHKRTLADWQREAAECNMDYGNYRAQIEVFGKTYEELKATADRRQMPNHAHGHKGVGHLG